MRSDNRMLKVATQIYRTLLHLYPRDFYHEFGAMMAQDFYDLSRDTYEKGGSVRLTSMWLRTLTDLVITATAEHLESRGQIIMTDLPARIDHYEIKQMLGDGAVANVYLAHDPKRKHDVALKVLAKENVAEKEPEFRDYFANEAQVWSELDHPMIPKVYDYVSSDEVTYIAMEYIEGKNLLFALEEQGAPLAEHEVIEWAVQVCDFLTYLHTHNNQPVIFRDMKPSNIMLGTDARLHIVDFGIARRLPAGATSAEWNAIGTEGYAPPEQYAGKVDIRSDIYALGASIYHLITGRDPRKPYRAFLFHIFPPRGLNPDVSEALETVILKATEFKAQDRFASANEMKNALLACL